MEKIKSKYTDYLIQNCFFSSAFASISISLFLYPLVANNENLRIGLSGIVNAIVLLIIGIECLKIFFKSNNKKSIIISMWPIYWIILTFACSFIKYGVSSGNLLSFAVAMLFSLQFSGVAIYILEGNKVNQMIKNFDYYGIILDIFAIFYIARFFVSTEENLNDFSGMSYMTIAYAYMTILMVFILKVLFIDKQFSKWKWASILLYWVTIVYTGTRGPIACTALFFLVVGLYCMVKKYWKKLFLSIGLGILFSTFLFFSIYYYSPEGTGSAGRLQNIDYDREIYNTNAAEKVAENYIINISETKKINSEDFSVQEIYTLYITENDNNIEDSIRELQENKDKNGNIIAETEDEGALRGIRGHSLYRGRDLLKTFAISEFKKSPLIGNGPMFFINKYNEYSHNIITEILCDYGIVGCILFAGIMLTLVALNMKKILANNKIAFFAIISVSTAASFMLSGNMYQGGIWAFLCTFATYNILNKKDDYEI